MPSWHVQGYTASVIVASSPQPVVSAWHARDMLAKGFECASWSPCCRVRVHGQMTPWAGLAYDAVWSLQWLLVH